MIQEIAVIVFFGLKLYTVFGMLAFSSLILTALAGYLNARGNNIIPFSYHPKLAFATVLFAVCHVVLVVSVFFIPF